MRSGWGLAEERETGNAEGWKAREDAGRCQEKL